MEKLLESVVKRIGENANLLRVLGVALGVSLIFFSINVTATIKIQVVSTSKIRNDLFIGFGEPGKRPFGQENYYLKPGKQEDISKSMQISRMTGGSIRSSPVAFIRLTGPYKLKVQVYYGKDLCTSKDLENKSENEETIILQCDN
jgi:hypothetical protein